MKIKKIKVYLFLIFLLAAGLRLYKLNKLPLFGDELDVGYQAYSLWNTGRDYMGQRFPFYIHSFSEWRAPLLMYVTAPFVGIFGLNEWAVRLPAVILGVANVFLLYVLVKTLTNNQKLSLASAAVLAIIPWHIHYSRVAFEVTLLVSLVLLGTISMVKSVQDGRWRWLAVISFALSFYTYNTANLFVPIWMLVLVFLLREKVRWRWSALAKYGLLLLLMVLPVFLFVINGKGADRFRLISIFNDPKTVGRVVFERTTGLENRKIERVFHNKITGWGKEFIANYLTAFSPQFLFLSGDLNPRHNPPGFGELYWILAPFLLIGIFDLLKSKNLLLQRLIFTWLLLAPLPSSLTVGGGNQATRLFLMLPPLAILVALGWWKLAGQFLRFKMLFFAVSFLFLANSLLFWFHDYFIHYPKEQYRYWHYGYKEAFTWLATNESEYDLVIINNSREPSLLSFLFWTKKDPSWFQKIFVSDAPQKEAKPAFEGFWLGKKWLFGRLSANIKQEPLKWFLSNLNGKSIYLAVQKEEIPGDWDWSREPPGDFQVLKTVRDPWGKPLMYWIAKKDF